MVISYGNRRIKIVTFHDAVNAIEKWSRQLPNYDLFIGIPRSGLMVASVLALKRGKPLSTPTSFLRGETWQSLHVEKSTVKRVLLVEDDIIYGKQISKAYAQLKTVFPTLQIDMASLYVTSQSKHAVNYYFAVKNPPLLYEWTLLTNMATMGKLAVDMDGVLCGDNMEPFMIPQFPVEAVITSRLEWQRQETEEWLRKHNVRYKQLLMLNLAQTTQKTLDAIINHKVEAIKQVKPFWFWESNPVEAVGIRDRTGIPVLCTATLELLF